MATRFRPHSRRGGAFTLVELLVVIGIIAVLISVFLPALTSARRAADKTACAARIHQLLAATTMYLNEHKHYPDAKSIPAFNAQVPCTVRENVLNAIGPYVSWPELKGSETVDQLPALAVCNVRLQHEVLFDPYPPSIFGTDFWLTGYGYAAGVMDAKGADATAIRPERIVDRRGKRRGVVWGDYLIMMTTPASKGWAYYHMIGGHSVDPATMTVPNPVNYIGHHSGWSDGSVEWLPRGAVSLDAADADTAATYRAGSGGMTIHSYF